MLEDKLLLLLLFSPSKEVSMDGSAIALLRVTTTTVGVGRRFVFASVFIMKVKQKETNNRIVRRGSICAKKLVVRRKLFSVSTDKERRKKKRKKIVSFIYLS